MTRWPPPLTLSASFYKGHGLGNDYLVFEEGDDWRATPANLRRVCDRHVGVGSDGIVALLADRAGDVVRLRMFNPDGSEFERSGNGLRVLASYLMRGQPSCGSASTEGTPAVDGASAEGREVLEVEVGGSRVRMLGHGREGARHDISVEMGSAEVGPESVALDAAALDPEGRMAGPDGEPLRVAAVGVGNPHIVVFCQDEADLSEERLARLGPFLSGHPALAHGANVQLALHDGGRRCRALIWERGVGRTSASGTSSCAVAVAMVATGAVDRGEVTVRMPGGELTVTVGEDLDVVLRGPVEEVFEGRLSPRFFD